MMTSRIGFWRSWISRAALVGDGDGISNVGRAREPDPGSRAQVRTGSCFITVDHDTEFQISIS